MTDDAENESFDANATPRRKKRGPGKVSRKNLENAALHYLRRFSTSTENLRRVLMRRVWRSAHHHDTDSDEGGVWVDEVVAKMHARGFVNDRQFAEGRVRSLLARGVPLKGVRLQLRDKGVDTEIIDEVLRAVEDDDGDVDFSAAIALAKRRRLGPFSLRDDRDARREKDMAAMARAGFGYDVVRRVINAETPEALEAMRHDGGGGGLGYFPEEL